MGSNVRRATVYIIQQTFVGSTTVSQNQGQFPTGKGTGSQVEENLRIIGQTHKTLSSSLAWGGGGRRESHMAYKVS